jgi:hypothetical protein
VLFARLAVGVNVATRPEYVTVPATAAPPGPVTVKVAALIVPGFIASLNVALSVWLTDTFVAPLAGNTAVTTGGEIIAAVVKDHTYGPIK